MVYGRVEDSQRAKTIGGYVDNFKGGYSSYTFLTDILSRSIRGNYKGVGFKRKPNMQECMSFLYRANKELVGTLDFPVMAEEYFWQLKGRQAVFPESPEVLRRLQKGRFDIKNVAGISQPHDSYMLSFPKGFEIGGRQARGVLVTWMPHVERSERISNPFFKYTGLPAMPPIYDTQDSEILEGETLAFNYASEDGGMLRVIIPKSKMPAILSCETVEGYRDIIQDLSNDGVVPLDEEEKVYQFELVKLIIAFGVYCSAFDGALVSGFPGKEPKFFEPKLMDKFNKTTLAMKGRESPASHYRSWHVRQLIHEKYYKGEHEGRKPGSRVVFVSDSYVGKKIEPETLK